MDHATLPNVPANKGLFGAKGRNQSAISRLGGNFIAAHHDQLVEMIFEDMLKETCIEMNKVEELKRD